MADDRESYWAAFFAALPVTETVNVVRRRSLAPIDLDLLALFRKECESARLVVERTYSELDLSPSWKSICREAASADDAFADMQQAREHYDFWTEPWLPGWPTPAQALALLALEANRQAEMLAELGDVDEACELYTEGQAYLLELRSNEAEFRAGHAEMKKRSTADARTARWTPERERQVDLICGSLSELRRNGLLNGNSSGKDVVLALEHFWEKRSAELMFAPSEMEAHIRRLLNAIPGLSEELSDWAGIKGPLVI